MSREAQMGMGGKSRGDTSSGNTGNGGNTREQYGAVGQYTGTSPTSTNGGGSIEPPYVMVGGKKFAVDDPAAIEAQNTIERQNFLDKTIELYQKYSPFGFITNLFSTAPDFVNPPPTREGEGEFRTQINQLTPFAPYALTNTTPQQSIVNDYFANANLGQQLSSDLQTRYNNAKNNLNNVLNIQSVESQYGFVRQPNLLDLDLTGLI
tara:strand:+ start:465 stop:1085 length:621 start_codon:yes stop_codon:yes gene_type:complete